MLQRQNIRAGSTTLNPQNARGHLRIIPGGIRLEKESDKRARNAAGAAGKDADYKDAEAVDKAARDFNLSSNQSGSAGREGRPRVQSSYTGKTIGSPETRENQEFTGKEGMTSKGRAFAGEEKTASEGRTNK